LPKHVWKESSAAAEGDGRVGHLVGVDSQGAGVGHLGRALGGPDVAREDPGREADDLLPTPGIVGSTSS